MQNRGSHEGRLWMRTLVLLVPELPGQRVGLRLLEVPHRVGGALPQPMEEGSMSIWQRIKCAVGLHSWKQPRTLNVYDIFPSPFDASWQTPERQCARCEKWQWWLPGYGGSELGCWCPGRRSS